MISEGSANDEVASNEEMKRFPGCSCRRYGFVYFVISLASAQRYSFDFVRDPSRILLLISNRSWLQHQVSLFHRLRRSDPDTRSSSPPHRERCPSSRVVKRRLRRKFTPSHIQI